MFDRLNSKAVKRTLREAVPVPTDDEEDSYDSDLATGTNEITRVDDTSEPSGKVAVWLGDGAKSYGPVLAAYDSCAEVNMIDKDLLDKLHNSGDQQVQVENMRDIVYVSGVAGSAAKRLYRIKLRCFETAEPQSIVVACSTLPEAIKPFVFGTPAQKLFQSSQSNHVDERITEFTVDKIRQVQNRSTGRVEIRDVSIDGTKPVMVVTDPGKHGVYETLDPGDRDVKTPVDEGPNLSNEMGVDMGVPRVMAAAATLSDKGMAKLKTNTLKDFGDATNGHTQHPTDAQLHSLLKDCPEHAKPALLRVLEKHRERFYVSGYLKPVKGFELKEDYNGPAFAEHPIPYRGKKLEILHAMCDMEVKGGLLREAQSDEMQTLSNVFLKHEKFVDDDNPGRYRRCHNYVRLNRGLSTNKFPIPRMHEMTHEIANRGDHRISLDCASAYNTMRIARESQKLFAFILPPRPGERTPVIYCPTRAPFGPKNLPSLFNEFILKRLGNIEGVLIYFDDITIAERDPLKAIATLDKLFDECAKHGIMVSFKKTKVFEKRTTILGSVIDGNQIHPDPNRIRDIHNWKLPTTRKQCKGFLGLYEQITSNILPSDYGAAKSVVNDALKNKAFEPGPDFARAFKAMKEAASKCIAITAFDPTKEVLLQTDSSGFAMGYVLSQFNNATKCHQIFSCGSKKWPPEAKNYPSYRLEALALIRGVQKYAKLLQGATVVLESDNNPAVKLLTTSAVSIIPTVFLRYRMILDTLHEVKVRYTSCKNLTDCCGCAEPQPALLIHALRPRQNGRSCFTRSRARPIRVPHR